MMEILGPMPKNMALSGKHHKSFFDKTNHLKRIRGLRLWPLKKVLMEKYKMKESEAESFSDFLLPMLEWYPERRATAQDMLKHPWLSGEPVEEIHMSQAEY